VIVLLLYLQDEKTKLCQELMKKMLAWTNTKTREYSVVVRELYGRVGKIPGIMAGCLLTFFDGRFSPAVEVLPSEGGL